MINTEWLLHNNNSELFCPTKWGQGADRHECHVLAAKKYTLNIGEPGGDKVRAPLLPLIAQEIQYNCDKFIIAGYLQQIL
jgi:hypothetical protein